MKNISIRTAAMIALCTAIISGTNQFLTKIAVTVIKDPVAYTTLKNSLVAVAFIGLVVALKKWNTIRTLNRKQWLKLILIGAIGGSIPFALYFTGLTQTTAINASLIQKSLFLWVAIFATFTLKERMVPLQWVGVALLFAANIIVGGFTGFKFNAGEYMILGATVLWAVETIIAKYALRDIPSVIVGAARMTLGSLILLAIVGWQGNFHLFTSLNSTQWYWTLLTSALLVGYVFTWFKALAHAPATLVTTLLVPATLITNVLSAIFVTHTMTPPQLQGAALFILGTGLVFYFATKSKNQKQSPAFSEPIA